MRNKYNKVITLYPLFYDIDLIGIIYRFILHIGKIIYYLQKNVKLEIA